MMTTMTDPTSDIAAADIATQIQQAFDQDKLIFRSLYMISITSLMFGCFGALVGWLMAIVTPAYFTDVYDTMESEAWQVGLGLGVSRGLICGVIIGCSVLLATSWYRSRIKQSLLSQLEQEPV